MKRIILAICVLAAGLALSEDLGAQDSGDADAGYAELYSEGMQAYVDGDYERSVDLFYRAYGLDQKPLVARLIVRSFDFMGACDRAMRQRAFYRSEHPDDRDVRLQQCSNPARVRVNCGDVGAPVHVDDKIQARCGETLSLAPGRHVFTSPALDTPTTLDLEAGEEREVSLAVDPKKWSPPSGEQPRKWQREHASTGEDPADEFSVYQSRDGIYRVWVRYDLLRDPDMHSGDDDQPRVLRLCDVDQAYDDEEENCVPLEQLQIDKVE
ncbi:MAG: hypothetical protein ACQEVA_16980 [Myxococcota bacterium]